MEQGQDLETYPEINESVMQNLRQNRKTSQFNDPVKEKIRADARANPAYTIPSPRPESIMDYIKTRPATFDITGITQGYNNTQRSHVNLGKTKSHEENLIGDKKTGSPIVVGSEGSEIPTLTEIGGLVKSINKSQEKLEKLVARQGAPVFNAVVTITDYVREKCGYQIQRKGVYELFQDQRNNVSNLNFGLVKMVAKYSKDFEMVRMELDKLIDQNEKEFEYKQKLGGLNIESLKKRHSGLKEQLEGMQRENPKYYNMLREYLQSGRDFTEVEFGIEMANEMDKHHVADINNLIAHEELFNIVLRNLRIITVKNEMYQESLERSVPILEPISKLAYVTKEVEQGICALARFNQELFEAYLSGVREITSAYTRHPTLSLVQSTTNDMKNLLQDLNPK